MRVRPKAELYRVQLPCAGVGNSPKEAVTRVLADVRAFTVGAKQSDEITILAVRYTSTPRPCTLRVAKEYHGL